MAAKLYKKVGHPVLARQSRVYGRYSLEVTTEPAVSLALLIGHTVHGRFRVHSRRGVPTAKQKKSKNAQTSAIRTNDEENSRPALLKRVRAWLYAPRLKGDCDYNPRVEQQKKLC